MAALLRTIGSRLLILLVVPLTTATTLPVATDSTGLFHLVRADTSVRGPVILDEDTVFVFAVGIKGMPADRRAELVSRRIMMLADMIEIPVDSIEAIESEQSTDIVAADLQLFSVFDVEASYHRETRDALARQRLEAVQSAVARYRTDRTQASLLRGLILSVLATILLLFALWLLGRTRRSLEGILSSRVRAITVKSQEIIRAEWLRGMFRFLTHLVWWMLLVGLLYIYLEFVLNQFVWTRPLARHILALVLEPVGTLGKGLYSYLPNFFFLLVLYVLTRMLFRFLRVVFREVQQGTMVLPGFDPDWAMPTFRIVRLLLLAFVLVIAFPYIPGSSSPAFQGVSIFLGLLLSLGSSSAVGNVVAGVIITYMRSFKVGDVVRIQDNIGAVTSHGLLTTKIRTWKNVEVTIPNSTVLSTHVTNYSVQAKEGKLIFHTTVTIGYDAPWRQVHALLLMAAQKTPGLLKEPEPYVLQKSLDDFYVTYELNAFTDAPLRMERIYSALHKNIQDAFNEYGVQIMSPNYLADRESPTTVPKKRWYAAPAKKPGEPGSEE
jgi:small-conductance mechanosensitive channel